MYFHLTEHLYATYFNGEVITLNLKTDKYHIFDDKQANKLKFILESQWIKKSRELGYELLEQHEIGYDLLSINDFIRGLVKNGFLQVDLYQTPLTGINWGKKSSGVEEIDWKLPLKIRRFNVSKGIIQVLFILARVHLIIKS